VNIVRRPSPTCAGVLVALATLAAWGVACAPFSSDNAVDVDPTTPAASSSSDPSASSSTPYAAGVGGDGSDENRASFAGNADDGNTDASAIEGGADADIACRAMSSSACFTCCQKAHPSGAKAKDDAYYSCVCDSCRWACILSLCNAVHAQPVAGDACDNCMKQAGTCAPAIQSACAANDDCIALDQCNSGCP
jgi:hypothetical protein